jgi:Emfourin
MWLSYVRSDPRAGRVIGLTIDTNRLPSEHLDDFMLMVETWRPPAHGDVTGAADRTLFIFTVEHHDDRRQFAVIEGEVPPPLIPLWRWLDERAHR